MWRITDKGLQMNQPTVWWTLAGGLIAVEMLTGTFYLLMMALGMAGGALAAHAGIGITVQIVVAALVGGGAVTACYFWNQRQGRHTAPQHATANKAVNLDMGGLVEVHSWGPSNTTTVKYRGADWAASLQLGETPEPGQHRIVDVRGSQLVLQTTKTTSSV
jgi:membrane protein implicated in regulation of membrane protease activity